MNSKQEELKERPQPGEEQAGEKLEVRNPRLLRQSLTYGTSTFLAAGAVDLFAHLGLTGLVVGGLAAYVAARHGPEVAYQLRDLFPAPAPSQEAGQASPQPRTGKRSLADRALGRFPSEVTKPPNAPDEEDTRLVSEEADEPETPPPAPFVPPRELIDLAPNLPIHQRDLAGKAIFVCGMRRHGKTTLGARLAEQFGKHYLPLFIPDLEGDYLSLADVLPRAVVAGHPRVGSLYQPQGSVFAPLDSARSAWQLGNDLLEVGYQVILDLSSYTALEQAINMQVNVIRGLFHWTNTHHQSRVPCHVYLDEAQRYLPQTLTDSVILDRTLLSELLRCYMDLIAIGGKRGLAPVILTERIAQVNKKIMAQSEVFFLLRQTHDGDLERCMEYVRSEVATREQIARFRPGQGIYIAADGRQVVTQFKRRESSGQRSQTPEASAAWRYAQMPFYRPQTGAATAAPSSEEDAAGHVQTPPRAEPPDLPDPMKVRILPIPTEQKPQPTLKDAIGCWNELIEAGQYPSRNNLQGALLAKGFECRENWARKFYEDIKALQEQASAGG